MSSDNINNNDMASSSSSADDDDDTRVRSVSFGIPATIGGNNNNNIATVGGGRRQSSMDDFHENGAISAISYYYDEEYSYEEDEENNSRVDGISFSTATATADVYHDHHDDGKTNSPNDENDVAVALDEVDAVPSAFIPPPTIPAGDDGQSSSGKKGTATTTATASSFRACPSPLRCRRRRQDSHTVAMTGITPSSKWNNKHHNNNSSSIPPSSTRTNKAVLRTKIAFFSFLLFIAAVSSYLLYTWLTNTEATFAQDQFQSIAERALLDSADVVSRKRLSMATMSTMISEQFRKEEDWPEVSVVGYDRITNMGFAPIVKVSEQPAFESFAYTYFASRPDFPPTTGINSPDWRGIWRFQNGTRIHDADTSTAERGLLTPIFQCCIDNPGDKVLLFNLHSEVNRRETIDGIIECTNDIREKERERLSGGVSATTQSFATARGGQEDQEGDDDPQEETSQREEEGGGDAVDHDHLDHYHPTDIAKSSSPHPDYSCGSMTDFVKIVRFKTRGPASIMFQPVYPAQDPWNIRGLVLSPMAWDEVLEQVFTSMTNGIHAVLESETKVWTYTILNGRVESFHEGDIHQSNYDDYGVSTNLTWDDLHEMGAPMYKLSLYPTDDFVKSYSTSNPINATITAVSIIVFISILFLLYDYYVRRAFLERHQLLEAKRRFIRFVSHEVRTPLNAVLIAKRIFSLSLHLHSTTVMMGLNIIEAEMEPNTESLELLREIQNSTESAVDVLNDVLLYDKIESTLMLDISMVPIWQIIEHTLSEFKSPAARRQVHIRATYETSTTNDDCAYDVGMRVTNVEDLPQAIRRLRVAGDASRLTQILRNLLSNALKFSSDEGLIHVTASYHIKSMDEEGTVKGKGDSNWQEAIELHNGETIMATPRGHCQIIVQDTGVGMSQEQISKLFGEGVQFNAHELQAGKGSGLGLFIAKGLVEQHKGTLDGTSEGIDKGSRFTLKLPLFDVPSLSVEEERSVPDKENSNSVISSLGSKGGLRLLVVDDNLSNRTLLCRLLERKGHKCDMAENGQMALEIVRDIMLGIKEPYDSILMDYEMPVMNGPTASNLIRELGSDVFIIGITGNVLSNDVRYFKSNGANAVLPKPVQLSLLEDLFMEYHLTY
ncbi:hypothetical protein ACHAXR_008092 [Thalassiosira sp. AJA248-18]